MIRRAAALAIALSMSLFAGQRPAATQTRGRGASAPIPEEALTRARARGTVRVIARLNVTNVTLDAGPGPAQSASQRASIAAAQASVLGRLPAAKALRARRFVYIPYLAVEVDEADLQQLAAQTEVTEIRLDRLARPTLQQSLALTGAAQAAAEHYKGAGTTIAVLDTGIDKTHPALSGKVVSEACYSTTMTGFSTSVCPGGAPSSTAPDSAMPCAMAGCAHGTHVASIAAGRGGVAGDASIISIQVFSSVTGDCGSDPVPCARAFDSDVLSGLERVHALRNSYRIASVNLSLGRDLFSAPCDGEPVKPIIDQLRSAGIAVVIASGNNGSASGLSAPACVSSAISVGSTTDGSSGAPVDQVSTFTNSNAHLTLLAPGETITAPVPGGGFASLNGTSQAAPHVAGAWALMKERNINATVTEVANALISTGAPIFDSRNGLTKPRIRIFSALFVLPVRCRFSAAPTTIGVPRAGGTVEISLTASEADCRWTLSTQSSFFSPPFENGHTLESGYGSRTILVTVPPNPYAARSGVVWVAGIPVTIDQIGGVAGDFNGDGRADLIWQHLTDGSLAIWSLSGRAVIGTSSPSVNRVTDPNWRIVGSGDVNGDGPSDLVWQHELSGRLAIWYLSGNQVISTVPLSIDRVADTDWKIRGVGDTNGDGFADLVWQHRTQGWLAVWLMNGAQVISTEYLSINRLSDTGWQIAAAGDVDGDGKADIIWQHQTNGTLAVWFLNRSTVTSTRRLSIDRVSDGSWQIRAAGDTNGDGRADLLWQHDPSGVLGVWYMAGGSVVEQWRVTADPMTDTNWRVVGPG